MPNFGNCEATVNHRRIVFKENKRKITFYNDDRKSIRRIIIDNCVITEGIKCDYLMIAEDDTEYYIELKGCDVRYAIQQIIRTIKTVSSDIVGLKKYSYIISSRCPLSSTETQLLRLKFKRRYNSVLKIKTNYYEEKNDL